MDVCIIFEAQHRSNRFSGARPLRPPPWKGGGPFRRSCDPEYEHCTKLQIKIVRRQPKIVLTSPLSRLVSEDWNYIQEH